MSSAPALTTEVTLQDTPQHDQPDQFPTISRLFTNVVWGYTIYFFGMMLMVFNASQRVGVLTDALRFVFMIFIFLNHVPWFIILYTRAQDHRWAYVLQYFLTMLKFSTLVLCLFAVPWIWYWWMDAWKWPMDKAWLIQFLNLLEESNLATNFLRKDDKTGGLALKILAVDLEQTFVLFTLVLGIVLELKLIWLCCLEDPVLSKKTPHHTHFTAFGLVNRIFPQGVPDFRPEGVMVFGIWWLNVDHVNIWLCMIMLIQCAMWVILVCCFFPKGGKELPAKVTLMKPSKGWAAGEKQVADFLTQLQSFNTSTFFNLIKMWGWLSLFIVVFKLGECIHVASSVTWWMKQLERDSLPMQIYVMLNAVRLEADFVCVMFMLFLMIRINAGIQVFPSNALSSGLPLRVTWNDDARNPHSILILVSEQLINALSLSYS